MRLKSRLRPPTTDVDTTQTCSYFFVIISGSASLATLTNQVDAAEALKAQCTSVQGREGATHPSGRSISTKASMSFAEPTSLSRRCTSPCAAASVKSANSFSLQQRQVECVQAEKRADIVRACVCARVLTCSFRAGSQATLFYPPTSSNRRAFRTPSRADPTQHLRQEIPWFRLPAARDLQQCTQAL